MKSLVILFGIPPFFPAKSAEKSPFLSLSDMASAINLTRGVKNHLSTESTRQISNYSKFGGLIVSSFCVILSFIILIIHKLVVFHDFVNDLIIFH